VLIIGGTTLDFIIRKEPVKKAAKIELKDDDFSINIGGGGSNAAYVLSYLGEEVYFLTKYGNDEFSHILDKFFEKNKKIKLVKTKRDGKTAVSFIFDFGDRVIYTFRGSLNNLTEKDLLEPLPNFEWLYITSNKGKTIEFVRKLFYLAKSNNRKVFVNPSLYSVISLREELLNADLMVLNLEEARELTKKEDLKEILDILNKKDKKLEKISIVTDGKNGCYFKKLGKYYHLKIDEAIKKLKIKPLDTTGAGDCFSATFFHFFVKRKFPLVNSLILATINSFNIIQKIGTKHSLSEKELINLLKKTRKYFKVEEL